jgi:hypothetical protein
MKASTQVPLVRPRALHALVAPFNRLAAKPLALNAHLANTRSSPARLPATPARRARTLLTLAPRLAMIAPVATSTPWLVAPRVPLALKAHTKTSRARLVASHAAWAIAHNRAPPPALAAKRLKAQQQPFTFPQ